MGHSMAGHLLAAGYPLRVHSRTRSKAEGLISRGAVWCNSPQGAAEGAEIALSMVGMPADVEAVHLGPNGTLSAKCCPRIIVDMSTSSPQLAERLDAEAIRHGARACDAPVTGGDVGARNATLSILVGSDESTFKRLDPLFRLMGKTLVRHGEAGQGQRAKLVNQILIAASMVGMCEGLASARACGLDPQRLLDSVSPGAAGSWALNNLAPRVLRGDLGPGFMIEHFVKDLGLARTMSNEQGIELPGVALAHRLYAHLLGLGHGKLGTQGLVLAYEPGERGCQPLAGAASRG